MASIGYVSDSASSGEDDPSSSHALRVPIDRKRQKVSSFAAEQIVNLQTCCTDVLKSCGDLLQKIETAQTNLARGDIDDPDLSDAMNLIKSIIEDIKIVISMIPK